MSGIGGMVVFLVGLLTVWFLVERHEERAGEDAKLRVASGLEHLARSEDAIRSYAAVARARCDSGVHNPRRVGEPRKWFKKCIDCGTTLDDEYVGPVLPAGTFPWQASLEDGSQAKMTVLLRDASGAA